MTKNTNKNSGVIHVNDRQLQPMSSGVPMPAAKPRPAESSQNTGSSQSGDNKK